MPSLCLIVARERFLKITPRSTLKQNHRAVMSGYLRRRRRFFSDVKTNCSRLEIKIKSNKNRMVIGQLACVPFDDNDGLCSPWTRIKVRAGPTNKSAVMSHLPANRQSSLKWPTPQITFPVAAGSNFPGSQEGQNKSKISENLTTFLSHCSWIAHCGFHKN